MNVVIDGVEYRPVPLRTHHKTSLGMYLRQLRNQQNMSSQKVADLTGCGMKTLNRIELDRNQPKFALIVKLARLYGVSVDDLADRIEG